jgi:hypothetical protein
MSQIAEKLPGLEERLGTDSPLELSEGIKHSDTFISDLCPLEL